MKRLWQVLFGTLVLGGVGAGGAVAQAVDSTVPYATLLQQYKDGHRESAFMRALARRARAEHDTATTAKIVADYVAHLREPYTPTDIQFVEEFTRRSTDAGFTLFYRQAAKVDQVMGESSYAEWVVDRVVAREEIDPVAFPDRSPSATEPNWSTLATTIAKKYDASYADRTVLRSQIVWYWFTGGYWPQFRRSVMAFVDRYGAERSRLLLNDIAWNMFLHSNDSTELATAASWMERECQREPNNEAFLDTYANLLYKVGRVDEGVALEERALAIATTKQVHNLTVYQETLAKMRRGEPTWPTE